MRCICGKSESYTVTTVKITPVKVTKTSGVQKPTGGSVSGGNLDGVDHSKIQLFLD